MYTIVADESVDFGIVQLLRNKEINVISIQEMHSGITDEEVLQIAIINKAVLITEDKDFGELVYRLRMKHNGVLLIRVLNIERIQKIDYTVNIILSRIDELADKFSVVSENKLRIK